MAEPIRLALAYRRLGPLWRALHDAFPQTHLDSPSHRLSVLLLRRVVEIRDGQQQLQPYLPPTAICAITQAAHAMDLTGKELEATVEAALISVALARYRAGLPAKFGSLMPSLPIDNVKQEIVQLERVAIAYARSPLTRAMSLVMAQHDER
ncbi:hypothetical protein GCM10010411_76840 [Actinomadura fulvescens]|uniref:DUF6545 domain-containing protein n=1 Tax=Actinomadura fulvescens TaxID=46160 RepID=A0ABP6CTP9_9ACTN